MKIAITGGLGFIGGRLAEALAAGGHEVVVVTRPPGKSAPRHCLRRTTVEAVGLEDEAELARAFAGCDAVAHCAGINRELGAQTYEKVQVLGTMNVVERGAKGGRAEDCFHELFAGAARLRIGLSRIEMGGRGDHSRVGDWITTIVKPGVIYGRGTTCWTI